MNVLVGKTISGIEISRDKEDLRFYVVGYDPIVAVCDGDCCSHTWIESVENTAIFPTKVLSVEPVGIPEFDGDNDPQIRKEWVDDGLVRYYGCKITTERGYIIIDYRNESNGYYGGSLNWPGDSLYEYISEEYFIGKEWMHI